MSKEIFTEYYRNNSWSGQESVSGPGSDYEQTKFLIPELSYLIKDRNIKSIFDAPCGDFNWMKRVDLKSVHYIGGDIVEPLITKNNKRYKSNNIKFINFDLTIDQIPKVDLIIIRDCLVHLPNEDILKVFNNVRNSGSKYLLTTHFSWDTVSCNSDIKVGKWRRINLLKEPFLFPFPEHIIVEGNTQSHDRDKTMSLWFVKDIPNYGDK